MRLKIETITKNVGLCLFLHFKIPLQVHFLRKMSHHHPIAAQPYDAWPYTYVEMHQPAVKNEFCVCVITVQEQTVPGLIMEIENIIYMYNS